MKYIVISRLAPGVDNVRTAFEVFGRVGVGEGSQGMYAATDGKTFVNIIDSDEPDMVTSATYAPFFEEVTILPVVDVDDAWVNAMVAALGNVAD